MVVAAKSYDLIVALLRSKELRSDAELIQLVRGWRTRAIHTCRNVRRAYSGYLPVSPPIDPHDNCRPEGRRCRLGMAAACTIPSPCHMPHLCAA